VNLHGCALPHCAPLLRRLRRTLTLRTASLLSSRYVAVYMTGTNKHYIQITSAFPTCAAT
jgi:hypothetical protein